MHIRICHINYKLVNQYSFPTNMITETVTHVNKMLFIHILIDNTIAMECISLFCTQIKDQNEIFFHFLSQISNIFEKVKNLDNMIFCCYWRKTTHKKHLTNLSSLEKCLLFLCPLMYSLIKKETRQRRKEPVTYLF
jgi:hypothetical protein